MVKIRATAKGRILGVDIDESLLAPSEKTMVEDLIAAAINDARAKADAAAAERNAEDAEHACRCRRDSSCPSSCRHCASYGRRPKSTLVCAMTAPDCCLPRGER